MSANGHDSDPAELADPLGLREHAPLLDAYLSYCASNVVPFTTPGHKGHPDLVGPIVVGDIPAYGGLDTIRMKHHNLAAAERRLADLWGADWGRISVGGSTHGNQTLALAIGRPGDTVIVSRTLHRSLLLGLVLAGLQPVWVYPDIDPGSGLPSGIPVDRVKTALAEHPDAKAVFLVEPGYVGTLSDVAGHASVAHTHGVPLVVDQAWGAYFGFHPGVPPHALMLGADALVTSAHKTLPAYTQGAIILARTGLLARDRLERAFEATHTTSPAGSIMASVDAVRALLEIHGERLLGNLLALVESMRKTLSTVDGLTVLDAPTPGPGQPWTVDPVKLAIGLAGTGADGLAIDDDLVAAGYPVEMADRDTIIAMVTVADDERSTSGLLDALMTSIERHRGTPRPVRTAATWSTEPIVAVQPREAFFAPAVTVAWHEAIGRVSAELVAPYPPGVPVLAPGELVTADALDALRTAAAEGTRVAYASDPTLSTLQVLAD
jgi:lysine decarboxylase